MYVILFSLLNSCLILMLFCLMYGEGGPRFGEQAWVDKVLTVCTHTHSPIGWPRALTPFFPF